LRRLNNGNYSVDLPAAFAFFHRAFAAADILALAAALIFLLGFVSASAGCLDSDSPRSFARLTF
jgi:hypothetical protein